MKHKAQEKLLVIKHCSLMPCPGYIVDLDINNFKCNCGLPSKCVEKSANDTLQDLIDIQLTPDELDYLIMQYCDGGYSWLIKIREKLEKQKEMWEKENE